MQASNFDIDRDDYRLAYVCMTDLEQYDHVHATRRTFIDDLGDTQASMIENDDKTDIYLLYYKGRPVSTARIHQKEQGYKIERVATKSSEQKKGLGRVLMELMHEVVYARCQPGQLVYLHAETHAVPFYLKVGYYVVGEAFIEDEVIEHYKMIHSRSKPKEDAQ